MSDPYRRLMFLGAMGLVACSQRGVTVGDGEGPGTETSGSGEEWSSESEGVTESTTSTTGETGEDGPTTDTGCGFIGCHDIPPPFDCDPFAQDCPEGDKCVPVAQQGPIWDTYACVPVMGTDAPGDACSAFGDPPGLSGEDSCALGSMCWDVDADTGMGWCVAQCEGTWADPICGGDDDCYIFSEGIPAVCLPQCDPLASDCDPERLCVPDPYGQFFCVPDDSGGVGVYGAGCLSSVQCNPGLICVPEDFVPGCISGSCCTSYCDLTEPDACPDQDLGVACVAYYEPGNEPEGLEHVGVCVLE